MTAMCAGHEAKFGGVYAPVALLYFAEKIRVVPGLILDAKRA